MNEKALMIFRQLLKTGMISREDTPELWSDYETSEVREALDVLRKQLDFDIYRASDRAYLIPDEDNVIFSKDNMDFRRDIRSGNDIKITDLYLLNYLSMYLLYEFFHGEGSEPLCRDFVEQDDFINIFTSHCESVSAKKMDADKITDEYSINFCRMAEQWLTKTYGEPESRQIATKTGCLNRVLIKMRNENLFLDDNNMIVPTQKLKDIMPYFLRKERTASIHRFLGGLSDAADQ